MDFSITIEGTHENRGAVDQAVAGFLHELNTAGAHLTTKQFDLGSDAPDALDPGAYTKPQLVALLPEFTDDELHALRDAEEAGKGRSTVVKAISDEIDARVDGSEEE